MMGWMAPLRHLGAKLLVGQTPPANREPSMSEITTVGLDLAKNVFQVHGVDAEGAAVRRKQLRRGRRRAGVLQQAAALSGGCRQTRLLLTEHARLMHSNSGF